MSINFDVVIATPEYEVDMKTGLETLQGVSDASRCIAETLVTGKVPQRQTKNSSVRTTLKKTFKGSYGQIYSVDMLDQDSQKAFRKIGRAAFVELMAYFMYESLYLEAPALSPKAHAILENMGEASDELLQQLRVSSMENIHKISTRFDHGVKIRYRQNSVEHRIIADFNQSTVLALQAKEYPRTVQIVASITRLNINTGNGRLLLLGEEETVAFGFATGYKQVTLAAKKKFSENLNYNNGIDSSEWRYLRIVARPVKLHDGRIVKYNVTGFEQDE